MKLVKQKTIENEECYYLDSISSLCDVKEILCQIECDGYVINDLTLKFVYDHATVLAPKEFTNSADLLEYMENMGKEGIEIDDVEGILYSAEKGNKVRDGYISVLWNVVRYRNAVRYKNRYKTIFPVQKQKLNEKIKNFFFKNHNHR